ncbi:hypothetical protein ASPVEDRAFT_46107 [Aspergillus versicolor CBS 583.65]|uniref:Uncharacterized protein n=1 Tax=Aspergillus versicolor CBS 583.65 TaxID=1036611 RepID=A0A1L9PYZ4_ASPVE|nr:uncharacterized protein ASPVEDRAFT_46107 [Aspergillus versicolor CBS 583.65]OJJ06759.1 hypothetical protein ASPVEDRAFT_46107 [Aspergillus versicolor CBS 583.65]
MSTTTSSSAAAATCTGNAWVLPVQDIACGLISTSDKYSDIMDKCCGDADVESYNDDCGLYCLAQGQSGNDLLDCIREEGAKDGDFFCGGGNLTHTASAALPSSTANKDNDSDNDSDNDADSEDSSDGEDNAAVRAPAVNKAGLGVLAMLFCTALLGYAA